MLDLIQPDQDSKHLEFNLWRMKTIDKLLTDLIDFSKLQYEGKQDQYNRNKISDETWEDLKRIHNYE